MSKTKPERPAAPAPAAEVTETTHEVVNEAPPEVTPPVTEGDPNRPDEGPPNADVPPPPEVPLPGGLGIAPGTTVETNGTVIETNNAVENTGRRPVVASEVTEIGGTVVETFVGVRPDAPWADAGKPAETAE